MLLLWAVVAALLYIADELVAATPPSGAGDANGSKLRPPRIELARAASGSGDLKSSDALANARFLRDCASGKDSASNGAVYTSVISDLSIEKDDECLLVS